jgi:hypothetical protein
VANRRFATLIEAAIELGTELKDHEFQTEFITRLSQWWQKESFPGISFDFEQKFTTLDERKFWAQVFETLAWRVFHRRWGNQENDTWQVSLITECHVLSTMLMELVWEDERGWYPERGDRDGIRPDPLNLKLCL